MYKRFVRLGVLAVCVLMAALLASSEVSADQTTTWFDRAFHNIRYTVTCEQGYSTHYYPLSANPAAVVGDLTEWAISTAENRCRGSTYHTYGYVFHDYGDVVKITREVIKDGVYVDTTPTTAPGYDSSEHPSEDKPLIKPQPIPRELLEPKADSGLNDDDWNPKVKTSPADLNATRGDASNPPGQGESVDASLLNAWYVTVRGDIGTAGYRRFEYNNARWEEREPQYYIDNKKEGWIAPITYLHTVEGDNKNYKTEYKAYGYYKNIAYCSKYLGEGNYLDRDPSYIDNDWVYLDAASDDTPSNMMQELSTGGVFYLRDLIGSDNDLVQSCLAGQNSSYERGEVMIDPSRSSASYEEKVLRESLDTAMDEIQDTESCESLSINRFIEGGAKKILVDSLSDEFLDSSSACMDGASHAITLEVLFRGGEKTSDGGAEDEPGAEDDPSGETPGSSDSPGTSDDSPGSETDPNSEDKPDSDPEEKPHIKPDPVDEDPTVPPSNEIEIHGDILEPCEVAATNTGGYYTTNKPNQDPTNQEYSIRQSIWNQFIINGLSEEQTAAVMGNIQGLSQFNPASLARVDVELEDEEEVEGGNEESENGPESSTENEPGEITEETPQEDTDETPVDEEKATRTEEIGGLGLILWGDPDVVEDLLNEFSERKVFEPFFEEENWEVYGAETVNGDKFIELSNENKVFNKAETLVTIQINRIINELKGTNFYNYEDIEDATGYFFTNVVKTTGNTETNVPVEFVENAKAIFEEFNGEKVPEEPEAPKEDPDCTDGYKRVSAGLTIDLLNLIKSSVAEGNGLTETQKYKDALVASGVNAQWNGKDSFAFVAAMMRASKFHPNFPIISSANSIDTLEKSEVWEKVFNDKTLKSLKDLKIGDIVITSSGSHTMIYIGNQKFNDKKPFAMALNASKYPLYVKSSFDAYNKYSVFRRKTVPALDNTNSVNAESR